MKKTEYFRFNISWAQCLDGYPPEVRLDILDAIIQYATHGTLPENLKPNSRMALTFICREIDENRRLEQEAHSRRVNAGIMAARKRRNTVLLVPEKDCTPQPSTEMQQTPDGQYIIAEDLTPTAFISNFFHENRMPYISALCKELKTTVEQFRKTAQGIVNEWIVTQQAHSSFNDAARHLANLVRLRLSDTKGAASKAKKSPSDINSPWDSLEIPT